MNKEAGIFSAIKIILMFLLIVWVFYMGLEIIEDKYSEEETKGKIENSTLTSQTKYYFCNLTDYKVYTRNKNGTFNPLGIDCSDLK